MDITKTQIHTWNKQAQHDKNQKRNEKREIESVRWGVEIKDKYAFESHRTNYYFFMYIAVMLYIVTLLRLIIEVLK